MLKLAGGMLVIAATSLYGIRKASDVREGYRQMQEIQRMMYLLQSEIRYARAYLGEIFSHIGRQSQEPYRSWLLALSRQMEAREGGSFARMWEDGVRKYLSQTRLPEKELDRLCALGSQMGNTDVQMQIKTLDLYLEQLALSMDDMREEMKTSIRLYHCLGVLSGVFIAILLV